jgi:hypothetical protein
MSGMRSIKKIAGWVVFSLMSAFPLSGDAAILAQWWYDANVSPMADDAILAKEDSGSFTNIFNSGTESLLSGTVVNVYSSSMDKQAFRIGTDTAAGDKFWYGATTNGVTLELRLRVYNPIAEGGLYMKFGSSLSGRVDLSASGFKGSDGIFVNCPLSDWSTLRITYNPADPNYYWVYYIDRNGQDGSRKIGCVFPGTTSNFWSFGELGGVDVDIDYIRWTNSGSYDMTYPIFLPDPVNKIGSNYAAGLSRVTSLGDGSSLLEYTGNNNLYRSANGSVPVNIGTQCAHASNLASLGNGAALLDLSSLGDFPLCWTSKGSFPMSMGLGYTGGRMLGLGDGSGLLDYPNIGDSRLYWTSNGSTPVSIAAGFAGGRIVSLGDGSALLDFNGDGRLYWTFAGSYPISIANGFAGGRITSLGDGSAFLDNYTGDNNLYWTNQGCYPIVISSNFTGISRLTGIGGGAALIDRTGDDVLYWTAHGSYPLAIGAGWGGGVTTIYSLGDGSALLKYPGSTNLYWTSNGSYLEVIGEYGNATRITGQGDGTALIEVDQDLYYFSKKNIDLENNQECIPGDANGDGMIDVGDLGILAANYGQSGKTCAQGDFNGDGLVDVGDLGILAAHYGEGVNATVDFNADYAMVFGTTVGDEGATSSVCSGLGLPLIAGLLLIGLMRMKLKE